MHIAKTGRQGSIGVDGAERRFPQLAEGRITDIQSGKPGINGGICLHSAVY